MRTCATCTHLRHCCRTSSTAAPTPRTRWCSCPVSREGQHSELFEKACISGLRVRESVCVLMAFAKKKLINESLAKSSVFNSFVSLSLSLHTHTLSLSLSLVCVRLCAPMLLSLVNRTRTVPSLSSDTLAHLRPAPVHLLRKPKPQACAQVRE
jgi:hypothetical protein